MTTVLPDIELVEEFKDAIPCDNQPCPLEAKWVVTHPKDKEGACVLLICNFHREMLLKVIQMSYKASGGKVDCRACKAHNFSVEEITIHEL